MTHGQARQLLEAIALTLPADEVAATLKKVGKRRASNPADDGADLATLATRWHWGRYQRAMILEAPRRSWQPARGFALGELHALTVDGKRYELDDGAALLCATGAGKARLFVVPAAAGLDGELTRVEYIAQKGRDRAPVIYDHQFSAPYMRVQSVGGALDIVRGQSRAYIDLDRGIVK